MKVTWTEKAQQDVRRYMSDQEGLHALVAAVMALADDPRPPASFPWGGQYRRLKAGRYRALYEIEENEISVFHVDRVPG